MLRQPAGSDIATANKPQVWIILATYRKVGLHASIYALNANGKPEKKDAGNYCYFRNRNSAMRRLKGWDGEGNVLDHSSYTYTVFRSS